MNANESQVERIIAMTGRLTAVLQADLAALESGHPAAMRSIAPDVQQLVAHYGREVGLLKTQQAKSVPAAMLARLVGETRTFHDVIALHGRRLSCLRNSSEGMIRAIVDDVERRRRVTRTYLPGALSSRAPGAMLYNGVV